MIALTLYNLAGQQVAALAAGLRQAGSYSINWDGTDDYGIPLASGEKINRYIRVDQDHGLTPPTLSLLPQLARIGCAVFDIIAILPQAQQTRFEELPRCGPGMRGRFRRLWQQNHIDGLPLLHGKALHGNLAVFGSNLMQVNRAHNSALSVIDD